MMKKFSKRIDRIDMLPSRNYLTSIASSPAINYKRQ
jgi:hypothetical protein